MSRALMVVWLTVLWLVLWRDLSVANVLSGVVVAVVITLAVGAGDAGRHHVHPWGLARYVGYFFRELVAANIVLAREIVTPRNRIRTGIIGVPLPGASDLVVTIVANSVSLTPGTLTIEVQRRPEPVIFVHVLHLHDLDDARRDVEEMHRRVRAALEPIGTDLDDADPTPEARS